MKNAFEMPRNACEVLEQHIIECQTAHFQLVLEETTSKAGTSVMELRACDRDYGSLDADEMYDLIWETDGVWAVLDVFPAFVPRRSWATEKELDEFLLLLRHTVPADHHDFKEWKINELKAGIGKIFPQTMLAFV